MLNIEKELLKLANKKQAQNLSWFFKTGKGDYGEGDQFLGINMGSQRLLAKKYLDLTLKEVQKLLNSKYHEMRMTGLLILVYKYSKADDVLKKQIYNLYLKNTRNINNWDLVDVTTPQIVGNYLLDKDRSILYKLVVSKSLWERRIAVLACFAFIRENDLKDALKISQLLLNDKHDLIHKAVGWMLREVGKKDVKALETFLKKNYQKIARTMLRYAIEKFPEKKRLNYLKRRI